MDGLWHPHEGILFTVIKAERDQKRERGKCWIHVYVALDVSNN